MALEWNEVTIAVNLGADAEQRFTANGRSVVNFRGAANRTFNDSSGAKREETSWFRFVWWGDTASKLLPYLTKGTTVLVKGHLSQRTYEAQDGSKRESVEIVVDRLQFAGPRKDGETSARRSAAQPEPEAEVEFDDVPF